MKILSTFLHQSVFLLERSNSMNLWSIWDFVQLHGKPGVFLAINSQMLTKHVVALGVNNIKWISKSWKARFRRPEKSDKLTLLCWPDFSWVPTVFYRRMDFTSHLNFRMDGWIYCTCGLSFQLDVFRPHSGKKSTLCNWKRLEWF